MMPFWDKFWSHFRVKIGPICVSCQICAESPAATSPRYCFSLIFRHLRHSKTIEKLRFFDSFAVSAKDVLAHQISSTWDQNGPKFRSTIFQKSYRKRCKISSCFLYAFLTEIDSQNRLKLAPNLAPQMKCKTSHEKRPVLRGQGAEWTGVGGGGAIGPLEHLEQWAEPQNLILLKQQT